MESRISNDMNNPLIRIKGEVCTQNGRDWYRIENYDRMAPFFMSITNPDNVWMFISSTGGLTAGRCNCDTALFPYYTDDKVSENYLNTGSATAIMVDSAGKTQLWEPLVWNDRSNYSRTKTLYKSVYGDAIFFEEKNHDLGLVFSCGWEASPEWGIHRFASLKIEQSEIQSLRLLDGMRNILPAGVTKQTQTNLSNLLNAYKRSEADPETRLGMYALSATLTDQAEPSESLRANFVWSYGLDGAHLLLSESQLPEFYRGKSVSSETDVKGKRGAYFLVKEIPNPVPGEIQWGMTGEVNLDHTAVFNLNNQLKKGVDSLTNSLQNSIQHAREEIKEILRRNDGIQSVGSKESQHHHAASVLFNVMRGGYFLEGYLVRSRDFQNMVERWNPSIAARHRELLDCFPEKIKLEELEKRCRETCDTELMRLSYEYLPLTFSRRHGDPSRPWNRFHIRTRDEHGDPVTGYQGNWRDIFQNWEALGLSYPAYYPSMIVKFLNATTADGYNPYRISEHGIDWEVPEPENPWSNIGYWSDHQIIYLTRLIEKALNFLPGETAGLVNTPLFTHAEVPYRIASFKDLMADPYNSIHFDRNLHNQLLERRKSTGADGCLLEAVSGVPIQSEIFDKLLILLLAKLANFVPGGGIWMNTQRPEWNDANNALAGWGLSMVTLAYLIRYLEILERLLDLHEGESLTLHRAIKQWFTESCNAVSHFSVAGEENPKARYQLLKTLGQSASRYREDLYKKGLSIERRSTRKRQVKDFLSDCKDLFSATLKKSMREDGLFESYQVLRLAENKLHIEPLYPMLEGQVSGLSLDIFSAEETSRLLESLKESTLYRADQHSYMLYPNRSIAGFLSKNTIDPERIQKLPMELRKNPELSTILQKDQTGYWHFNGSFRNGKDLEKSAANMPKHHKDQLKELFEETFHHRAFTGRSGTFFAYEGLGSIYWHMVSKLLLAVQERWIHALESGTEKKWVDRLKEQYIDIRNGLGFNKKPEVYGAVPLDPYSHTPWGQGAKQPGMTGQVKEEILTRFAELGLVIRDGKMRFYPELILEDQWNKSDNSLEYTFCGCPIRVEKSMEEHLILHTKNGQQKLEGREIPESLSHTLFLRKGSIQSILFLVKES